MIIHPEVFATPDCPTVRIRESRDAFDLDTELPKIVARQGWVLGTYFNLQFTNSNRTAILSDALFMVVGLDERLVTSEADPYRPNTKSLQTHRVAQKSPWTDYEPDLEAEETAAA